VTGRWRHAIVALATVGVLVASACGSDAGTGSVSPVSTEPAADGLPPYDGSQQLPPNDVAALRRLYDPALEPLGVRLTRGALIDTSNNRYVPSNEGRHLALYVEPIGAYSNEQYVTGFWEISALITPDVFARWPQLASYDICQEPLPGVDDDPEPFPLTQINLTREAASEIDWENGDLVDLLALSRTNDDVKVIVNRDIRATSAYQAADRAARADVDATQGTTAG
jgi:hypothetical protein